MFRNLSYRKLVVTATLPFVLAILLSSNAVMTQMALANTSTAKSSILDPSVHKKGYVITPFGWFDPTHVIHVNNGTSINGDALEAKYGKVYLKHVGGNGAVPGESGFNNYASYVSGTTITSFSAVWTVPSSPSATYAATGPDDPNLQNYFLFNGIEDNPPTSIVQPVLQWGCSEAFCGSPTGSANMNAWYISAWVVVAGYAHYSSALQVYPGDQIYGLMVDNSGTWTVTIEDITQNIEETYSYTTSIYFTKLVVAQESNNLPTTGSNVCNWLSGNVDFYKLSVNSGGVSPSWSSGSDTGRWCNMAEQAGSASEVFLHEIYTGGIWIYPQDIGTGNQISGLSVSLYNSNNQLVQGGSGYSPLYVPITSSGTYHANFDNYGPFYFTNSPTTSNYDLYNW
jgi:hypothetical protein